MATKQKKLTVKEVQAKEPLADIYELSPYCKYIIMLKRSPIALNQNAELMQRGQHLLKIFASLNIPCAVFVGSLDDVQILELKGEKV